MPSPDQDKTIAALQAEVEDLRAQMVLLRQSADQVTLTRQEADSFPSLIQTMTEGFVVQDANGRLTFANKAVCDLLGYPYEEIIGRSPKDFVAPHQRDLFEKQMAVRQAGGKQRYELTCLAKDGTELHALVSAAPIMDDKGEYCGAFAVFTDLTGRKRIEQELAREHLFMRTLMDHLPDAVYIKDKEGKYVAANHAKIRRMGLHDDRELIGRSVFDFYPSEFAAASHQLDMQIIQDGFPVFNRLEHVIDLRGWDYWELTSKVPLRDAKGHVNGLVGISRDVTENRKSDEALRVASRMEATATLAGGIAHEFNNLMAVVLSNAELLNLEPNLSPTAKQMLNAITQASERAGNLAQQMLAYARGGKYQPVIMNVNNRVREILELERHSIPAGIQVNILLTDSLWPTMADPAQMGQIVMNLSMNAIEAIPAEGRVEFRTENRTVDAEQAARHDGLQTGRYVVFSVKDTGIGMSPEIREKVFEPFFSTKFPGRGLGLSAVYGIVKNHNGFIHVQSAIGEGTFIEVYLPALETGDTPRSTHEVSSLIGQETILLVDDQEMVLSTTEAILKRLGYRVLLAHHGQEALDIAAAYPGSIHLMLLDMAMPVMGGAETFHRMAQLLPDLKVILCSGFELSPATQELLDHGAKSFLQKPFRIQTLAAEIRRVLEN